MTDELVTQLTKELINFDVPKTETIFAGIDNEGPHIYSVYDGEARCYDTIGFASIGIGSGHANSQFMFAGHTWRSPFAETMRLVHTAKKKSEVAPGVGKETDMAITGPPLGTAVTVRVDIIRRLDALYEKTKKREAKILAIARKEVTSYVEEITKAAAQGQAVTKVDGGKTSADGASISNDPEKGQPRHSET